MKYIWLLRHAKSDWDLPVTDFERPLNAKGQRQLSALSDWLKTHDCQPQRIYSSPARRALTTAEIVNQDINAPLEIVPEIYEASLSGLQTIVNALPDALTEVMLVGHNPGLSMLAGWLAGEQALKPHYMNGEIMRPATLVQLEIDTPWSSVTRASARCLRVVHGKELDKLSS